MNVLKYNKVMEKEKCKPYGNYGAESIEDARILNIGYRYEPQVKIKGVWCVYDRREHVWTASSTFRLNFWRDKKARAFLDSNLVSMNHPMGDVEGDGKS